MKEAERRNVGSQKDKAHDYREIPCVTIRGRDKNENKNQRKKQKRHNDRRE